ncbi:MAG: DNA ligase-associated metallophosphoesterase [Bradymonadia bacterium]|jgi:DNA ligase-associated metallophosphoesterase
MPNRTGIVSHRARLPPLTCVCYDADMRSTHPLTIAGEALHLCPERALHWPRRQTLAVADLHWGKSATFRQFGLPLPAGVLAADLARLSAAIDATRAERVLVLGDLIHGAIGLTDPVLETVGAWLEHCPAEVCLVRGNHDATGLPAEWAIPEVDTLREGPFFFRHEPELVEGAFVWCGHIHPVVRFGGRRSVRVPCFHLDAGLGVLPAFSEFTGGGRIKITAQTRRFGIADGSVWPVLARGSRRGGRDGVRQ